MTSEHRASLATLAAQDLVRRTAENDRLFASLQALGLAYPTLSRCWKLSARGRAALMGGMPSAFDPPDGLAPRYRAKAVAGVPAVPSR